MLIPRAVGHGEEGIWWCGQVVSIFAYASWVQERLYCVVVRGRGPELDGLGSNSGPTTSELCALTFL